MGHELSRWLVLCGLRGYDERRRPGERLEELARVVRTHDDACRAKNIEPMSVVQGA